MQKCEKLVDLDKIMLKNGYLGAKIGFDTAKNELCKVCPLSVYTSTRFAVGLIVGTFKGSIVAVTVR